MRRRKKYGYILLTMLIVSGLAGTPTDNSLTKKERKFATEHLKNTRIDLISTLKDWNEAQLNFRTTPETWSAIENVYHLAASENGLWQLLEATMKAPVNPEKRSEIKMTEEQLVNAMQDKNFKAIESFEPKNTSYKSLDEALSDFKEKRTDHIKYIRNSTEDLRNHVAETPLGWLDCYQITLLISTHSNRHLLQINELKSQPGFPK